jgi:hypothetical protein
MRVGAPPVIARLKCVEAPTGLGHNRGTITVGSIQRPSSD